MHFWLYKVNLQEIQVKLMTCLMLFITTALISSSINPATSSDTPNYMSHDCNEKHVYAAGSVFEASLNDTLYSRLLPEASSVRFSNVTHGSGSDQVYALFYCRGDTDAITCRDCVDAATRKITDACRFSKEGIVWFEECTLRYANRTIFSVDEEDPYFPYRNTTGIVNELRLDRYKGLFDTTMDELVQDATADGHVFATKEANVSSTEMIRGLAQCTPDITGFGCQRCLKTALRLRDSWAQTMIFLPSCLFRYDLYEIAPVSSPSFLKRNQRALIIAGAVFVALIGLAVIGWFRLWRCCPNCNDPVVAPTTSPPPSTSDLDEDSVPRLVKYSFSAVGEMTKGFENRLGQGGYGVVYRGYRFFNGSTEDVAVKVLSEADALAQFDNEINVFSKISHKNLLSLVGYCKEGLNLALVYEYMDNGDLSALLAGKAVSLSWTDRLKIAIDTAEGLHYLHSHCGVPIIHRDVKPANILLNKKLEAKVADFGLTKIFPEKDVTSLQTRVVSTPGYTAPEYCVTGRLNAKVDVYSFGVVLVELITGATPRVDFVEWFEKLYTARDIEEILDPRIKEGRTQIVGSGCVWKAIKVAKTCVEKDEKVRPVMWNVLVNLKQCLDMVP